MCKCTPNITTPFCGKGDCTWPKQEGVRTPKEEAGKEPKITALIETTAHEYLRVDLKLPEWQALLISGKIGVCSENVIRKEKAASRAEALEECREMVEKELRGTTFEGRFKDLLLAMKYKLEALSALSEK